MPKNFSCIRMHIYCLKNNNYKLCYKSSVWVSAGTLRGSHMARLVIKNAASGEIVRSSLSECHGTSHFTTVAASQDEHDTF